MVCRFKECWFFNVFGGSGSSKIRNPNVEIRRNSGFRTPNADCGTSDFVIRNSFGFRHSDFGFLSASVIVGLLCHMLVWGQEPTAAWRLVVVETEGGPPLPCRIHLKDSTGKPVQPKGLPFWKDHFVCSGDAPLQLAPGNYTYEIERGPEYLTATGSFMVVESSAAKSMTNRLPRLTN